ncbi:MAG: DNA mismatch repair protein MutS, partial [Rhodobacteraceae bacterium]|nr:DNA mismatch repair protein MutS [Paracoccaceae bacterium]
MTRRKLTTDEIELWRQVADTARRIHPERSRYVAPTPKPKPVKTVKSRVSTSFEIGSRARIAQSEHNLLPALPERLA